MRSSRSSAVLLPVLVVFVIVQCKVVALPVLNHNTVDDEAHRTVAVPQKRTTLPASTTTTSNVHLCSFSEQSCHFYSHCIESHFHCGPLGFTQAYAEPRCDAINNLRRSDKPCEDCISNTALYNWAVNQDLCLKRKLVNTVENEFMTVQSDPPNCLQLERRGLELMRECSNEHTEQFCSALAENSDSFERDIEKIANHFRISAYYTTQVERTLRELVLSCNTDSRDIADAVISPDGIHGQRVVFCAFIYQSALDFSTAVHLVSDELGKPLEQFEFSGVDYLNRCTTNYEYPPEISPTPEDQLVFITWRPELNDPMIDSLGTTKYVGETDDGDIVFYQYLPLRSSDDFPECGDGRRQAGELCDTGVNNTDSYDVAGCDFTCQPTQPDYIECSTGQFESSHCWEVSCGDGVRSSGEECDDGNYHLGDGCSSICRQEGGYTCSVAYNRTSVCAPVTVATAYPPATTSPPSTFSVSHRSSPSLPVSPPSPSALSSSPPDSLSSPSSENPPPPIHSALSSTSSSPSSAATSQWQHWRTVVLQCLVSALLTIHLITTAR